MMSNVAQAPYLASIEAVSHIAKVCPGLQVDMSNVSNQGLFLRVVDFPSDSDREVEALPAPANLLGEETSGNASGPSAHVQARANSAPPPGAPQRSAPLRAAGLRPNMASSRARWKFHRALWIKEVANTMQWLVFNPGNYVRAERTSSPPPVNWANLRLPDPEALAVRRHAEMEHQLQIKDEDEIACCVCGAKPPFQFISEESCARWMKRPCIWDDSNKAEIEANIEVYERASKRLRRQYPDPWDAIFNIPHPRMRRTTL